METEKITHAWLKTLGFSRDMQPSSTNYLTLWSGEKYIAVYIFEEDRIMIRLGDSDSAVYVPNKLVPKTRLNFLTLCNAIGIEYQNSVGRLEHQLKCRDLWLKSSTNIVKPLK